MRKNEFFFCFSSQNFFDFCAKIFQTFGQKSSRSCQHYLLRVQTNNFWLEETFKSFEPFWIFCRNLWHGSQNFIYVARVKFAEGTFFSTVLFRISSNFHRNIFRLLAKKLQEVVKTTFPCADEQVLAWKVFFKILNRFGFSEELWHVSQTSIYVSRVKISEELVFFVFLLRVFFEFCAKIFQTFGQKSSRSCQNYLLRVQTNNFWLEETFKSFEPFWIFCRNLWHGSQNFIYVTRVKFAEGTFFSTVLFRIFSNFQRIIFRLLAKKLQEVVKSTFRVCRWTSFGLKSFLKILNRFGFSEELWHGSQTSIYVSRVKIAEELVFFCFSSQNFFRILRKNLSNFWPKVFKKLSKLPSACADEQVLAWKVFF